MIKKESLPSLLDFNLPPYLVKSKANGFKWSSSMPFYELPSQIRYQIIQVGKATSKKDMVRMMLMASEGLIWASTHIGRPSKSIPDSTTFDKRYWGMGIHTYGGHLAFFHDVFDAIKADSTIFPDVDFGIDINPSSHSLVAEEILKCMKI